MITRNFLKWWAICNISCFIGLMILSSAQYAVVDVKDGTSPIVFPVVSSWLSDITAMIDENGNTKKSLS